MIRPSPHVQAHRLRRTFSQLIFAWGSVASAAAYAFLTVLGRPPLIDDHLTVTALLMLGSYLTARLFLDLWVQLALYRFRSGEREDRDSSIG